VTAYKSDPQYKIIEFNGYSSWFSGQLDGEVINHGWILNNDVTADIVFDREQVILQQF
jgi:putative AlgH/UPF0301 family transcriptional regulator